MVYVSFVAEQTSVQEDQGILNVCLELRNVTEATQSEIWADVSSDDVNTNGATGMYALC